MNTIFKTKLDICDFQTIELPQNFKILHIDKQNGVPCIWYECDNDMPIVKLDIYCVGTCYRMDNLPPLVYIGTVQLDGYVWHFYRSGMDCDERITNNFLKAVKSYWDEEIIKSILSVLSAQACWDGATGKKKNPYQKEIDWLKSLKHQDWTKEDKERYISCLQRLGTGNPEQPETINSKWFKEHVYPHSYWKPSDEQIKALDNILNILGC